MVPTSGFEYDQELAIHDWMITHGKYDSNTLSQLPDFQENPNKDDPYGFLVGGVGICPDVSDVHGPAGHPVHHRGGLC